MVFKGRFFSSSKKSDSSSPDGSNSNSPRSFASNSPVRSDKKKSKSKDDPHSSSSATTTTAAAAACRPAQVKEGTKKKDSSKGKETLTSSSKSKHNSTLGSKTKTEAVEAASVSPILASSLGLNRIKTRSGPLPQESFFGFRGGDKGSALGASNLSRSDGKKKKEAAGAAGPTPTKSKAAGLLENWVDNGSNSDSMSTGSAQSRDQSPNVLARSRLHNGESTSEAVVGDGTRILFWHDKWVEDNSLKRLYPQLYVCCNDKETCISDVLCYQEGGNVRIWNLRFHRDFHERELEAAYSFLEFIQPRIPRGGGIDTSHWCLKGNGKFDRPSYYNIIGV
uniref:Uncharacterized protein n=1 Tax=Quercus lobata TaxID=97700 RepID=A0A7N2MQS3_QUELO